MIKVKKEKPKYKVTRQSFEASIKDMQIDPKNILHQKKYISQFRSLAEILLHKCHIPITEHEERKNDLLEISIRRNIINRIKPDQNAFAFYWTTMAREIWKYSKHNRNDCTYIQKHGIFADAMTDNSVGENQVQRELDLSMHEYEDMTDFDSLPVVWTQKGKIGQRKSRIKHWETAFNKFQKGLALKEIIEILPQKQRTESAINCHFAEIAQREGKAFSGIKL